MTTDATPPGGPGHVDPDEILRFTSADGTELYGEFFTSRGPEPRAVALVVHGYHEHCGRYRELAHVLVDAGVSTLSFDLRGHGRSQGQRGHIEAIADYLDDLDAALDELDRRTRAPDGDHPPRLLVAHSNGGLIALRALTDPVRSPTGLAAAILSSPFLAIQLRVPPAQKLLGQAASRVLPRLSMPNALAVEKLTSDPQKQEERRNDTLCHDVASARWYTATVAAQDHAAEFAARVAIPTLWLVAGADQIVDASVSRAVRARLRAPSEFHWLDGMQHEIFNERDRGRVFELVRAYLDDKFPRPNS